MSNRKWKKWTEKEIRRLIKYWESGISIKEIQGVFSKTRTAGAVSVKIHELQKAGKIKSRNKKRTNQNPKQEHIPMKVITKLHKNYSQEIKILKGQLESARKELKARLKYENDVWNKAYKSKWSKTSSEYPPWVEAGKKAMMGMPQPSQIQANMNSKIADKCNEIRILLQEKNAQYGDSAMNPIRVFSKADSTEQLKVRIDDKLSRLVRGDDSLESDEEVIKDLIGYLILLLIQYDTQSSSEGNA